MLTASYRRAFVSTPHTISNSSRKAEWIYQSSENKQRRDPQEPLLEASRATGCKNSPDADENAQRSKVPSRTDGKAWPVNGRESVCYHTSSSPPCSAAPKAERNQLKRKCPWQFPLEVSSLLSGSRSLGYQECRGQTAAICRIMFYLLPLLLVTYCKEVWAAHSVCAVTA